MIIKFKSISKINFEDKVVIGFATILVVIIFMIVYIILTSQANQQAQEIRSIPTPTPAPSEKLLAYVKNNVVLSQNDSTAKTKLLSLLPSGDVPGIIYQSSDFSVEYINSANVFLVEITTVNIQSAKEKANTWFLDHGMSQKGICTLPVEFYVNANVAQELRSHHIAFNSLPDGC